MNRRCSLAAGWLGGFALLCAPGPGLGQDQGIVTKVSTATLEKVLEDLGIIFQRKAQQAPGGREIPGMYLYFFKRNERNLALYYYGGKELMLQYLRSKLPVEKVNAWNIEAHFSRAYTMPDRGGLPGQSVLEWNLDCLGGVTRDSIKQFVRRFDDELKLFERFVGGNGAFPGPVIPKVDPIDPATGQGFRLPVAFQGLDQRQIEVKFPLGQKNWQTAWKLEWQIDRRPVPKHLKSGATKVTDNVYFGIKQAWFRAGPTERDPWIQVLNDARVSEMFVPYNDGVIRWYDVMDHGRLWKILPQNERAEAGPRGQVLGKDRFVVGEVRDRGLLYKNIDGRARRGETFVLWGNLNAGNYNYLIEYGFQDDGVITFRLGATGQNLHLGPKSKHDYPRMGHMHNAQWRLGIRLGPQGEQSNTAYLVRHVEREQSRGLADQVPSLFNDGLEGPAKWVAEEFTRVRIENSQVMVGRNRQPIAYELVPSRQGSSRHHGTRRRSEAFTLYDFWVTRADSNQFYYTELPAYFQRLKDAQKQPGKVANTSLVLWYTSSVLHEPRAEDGISPDHRANPIGPALVAWSGFELRPRNVFTGTPLFTPLPQKTKRP